MKILQIVYSGLGGNSSVAFSIVEGQIKGKYKNHFIFTGVEKIKKNYINKCKNLNIKSNYIKKKKFEINYFKLIKLLYKVMPDVLIIHDYNITPFITFSILKKKKIIYVHHTPDKTKRIIDWIIYFFNSLLSEKIVLVSKRKKIDFMYKLNNFFFKNKIKVIENGINISKFKK